MKRLFVWVMVGIIQAPVVFAVSSSQPPVLAGLAGAPASAVATAAAGANATLSASAPTVVSVDVDDFRGLGKDREHLTPELIAFRSERLQANTSVYLLRFPQAATAPSRIFDSVIWNSIQIAADRNNLDPMVLAGMIFIESFGDPLAKSPTGPAGIAQLTKASAKEMGLIVGKKTLVGSREVTKTRTVGKGTKKRTIVETRQVPVYKVVDERYVPERAIMAMASRVNNRRSWLGGQVDFAIAEYHMGAGRMNKLLSAYFGRKINAKDMPSVMRAGGLSYPDLFWSNTPYFRPDVYKQIEQLNRVDFSPTYYFRVRQAMRLLEIYKRSPSEYAALASNYRGQTPQTLVSNPQQSAAGTSGAEQPAMRQVKDMASEVGQRIVELPVVASQFGVRVGPIVDTTATAERSTIGCLLFVARQLEQLQGKKYKGFDAALPVQSLGFAFDLPRKPLSKDAVRDLNFILTDLRFAGLLAFAEEKKPQGFHVVRHPDHAGSFEQFYWDAVAMPQARAANSR